MFIWFFLICNEIKKLSADFFFTYRNAERLKHISDCCFELFIVWLIIIIQFKINCFTKLFLNLEIFIFKTIERENLIMRRLKFNSISVNMFLWQSLFLFVFYLFYIKFEHGSLSFHIIWFLMPKAIRFRFFLIIIIPFVLNFFLFGDIINLL